MGASSIAAPAALGHRGAAIIYTNLLASGIAGPRDWAGALQRLRDEARDDPVRAKVLGALAKMQLTPEGDPASIPEGRVLSDSPEVMLFPRLFSPGECDYLRRVAEPLYAPSTIFNAQRQRVQDPIRTSDGSTIHWSMEDPAVHAINRRLAAASGTPADHGEALQILRYRPGQHYRNHYDFVGTPDNQRAEDGARLSQPGLSRRRDLLRQDGPEGEGPDRATRSSFAMPVRIAARTRCRNMPVCRSPRGRNISQAAGFASGAGCPERAERRQLTRSGAGRIRDWPALAATVSAHIATLSTSSA